MYAFKCKPVLNRFSYIHLLLVSFLLYGLCFPGLAVAQTTTPYNWSSVAIGGGGFVSGIITSKAQPGLIYARTDVGGAYRWDTANSKWIPLTDFASDSQQGIFGVESIAIDEKSPNIVYLSAGISYFNNGKSYILRSSNYGASFTVIDVTSQFKVNSNGIGRGNGERLQLDPVNSSVLFCGTRANGLFQSNDAGTTWARAAGLNVATTNNGNGIAVVLMDSSLTATVNNIKKTQRLFVGVSRSGTKNIFRTDDGGLTYTPIQPAGILDTTLMPNRAVLSNNGYLYVTYANGAGPNGTTAEPCTTGQIWKYKVADGSWTNVTPLNSAGRANKPYSGISIDPLNANRLLASTTNVYDLQYGAVYGDKIYYSTDGGANWTDVVARGFSIDANGTPWQAGASIHWAQCIEFDPFNTNRVMIVSGNGTFINDDITAAAGIWKANVKGLEETVPLNLVSITGGPMVSVIGDYDGFTQTDPSKYAAQRHTPSMGSTSGLDYAVTNKKVVRVATSMYYSTDQGFNWTKTNVINGASGQVALSADGNVYLHCPNNSSNTYRSTDNGSTWSAISTLSINNARPVADGVNPARFYVYDSNSGSVYTSADGGVTFQSAANVGIFGSKIIRTVPGKEGHLWIALNNGGLVHSEDSGTSFTKSSAVTYCAAVGFGKAMAAGNYQTIYIYGTVNNILGIHRSTDKGSTWVRVNDDAHQYGGPGNGQFIQGDMNVYGRVYMSTAGRGIALGNAILSKTPSDINLNSTSILQNNQVGAVIGNLTTAVEDTTATFTYSLVNGAGSGDNASFAISGSQLIAASVFNYNAKQTYNIRIRTTGNGFTFEKAFSINILQTFTLPSNNFNVSVTNKTCIGSTDGKISITAAQPLNYKATVTVNNISTDYPFSSSVDIPSLNAGNYSVCITVIGQPAYQQCFNLVLTEPQPLSVYATVNKPDKILVLDLKGSDSYQVTNNDQTYLTSAGTATIKLVDGRNDITISTTKGCKGVFKKTVFVENGKIVYPNPFDKSVTINFGNDSSTSAVISLYSAYGALLFSRSYPISDAAVLVDLSDVKSGNYIIKVQTRQDVSNIKILKK
jgi:xyloglucan-specific exo-beta-1,4-glucanase